MGKKRVYEIAKKEGVSSAELLEALKACGVEVKAAASSIEESLARPALDRIGGNGASTAGSDETEVSEKKKGPGSESQKKAPSSVVSVSSSATAHGKRRRVVIDAQASRRQQDQLRPQAQKSGKKSKKRPKTIDESEIKEAEELEPTELEGPVEKTKVNAGSTVKDLSELFDISASEIIKKMMDLGEMVSITQSLSDDLIELLADEFERPVEIVHVADEADLDTIQEDSPEDLTLRPPVVVVMGHVDHGKTSLLDAIRETEVVGQEAGGITQHIGAYQVHRKDRVLTFLDTPGHEAFTAMRARGSKVTDLAVVVVAADDGVKPQTIEAIDHAKAAGVPILVAVNKIDKENAAPDKVRTELSAIGLNPEEWGGDTVYCDVSAKTKKGLDELLEMIVLVTDVMELKANEKVPASGTVIESQLDPGRGAVATMLVQRGTLRISDAIIVNAHWAKVRAMHDFTGGRVEQAVPGMPVEILGFDSVPSAGDYGKVVEGERLARQRAEEVAHRIKAEQIGRRESHLSLEDLFERAKEGVVKLNMVLKADVAGSLGALEDELVKLPQDEIELNIIHQAVGAVNESDVMLASASGGIVIAFNVRPTTDARVAAEREGVEIRVYTVIYKLVEEIRAAMEGMLKPEETQVDLGVAEVREVFKSSRLGSIAGCFVTDGKISRSSRVRVVRDGVIVYEGKLASLKRFKDDVREVEKGFECGMVVEDFADVKAGDTLEAFEIKMVERTLADSK